MHKTASTTLGGILARAANKYRWRARLYGAINPLDPAPRFGSRFKAAEKPCILYAHVFGSANEGNPAKVMMLPSGKKFRMRRLPLYDVAQLRAYYAVAVPGARLVVSLREPLARYVSMMNYFAHAERQVTKDEIKGITPEAQARLFYGALRRHVATGKGGDYQSRVLGLRNASATTHDTLSPMLPTKLMAAWYDDMKSVTGPTASARSWRRSPTSGRPSGSTRPGGARSRPARTPCCAGTRTRACTRPPTGRTTCGGPAR